MLATWTSLRTLVILAAGALAAPPVRNAPAVGQKGPSARECPKRGEREPNLVLIQLGWCCPDNGV
jgi:hypothetical protein